MKKVLVAITGVVLTFVIATIIVSMIILNSDQILSSFNFINVENIAYNFSLSHEKVKAAVSYEIVVYDSNNQEVYAQNVKTTDNEIKLSMLKYDNEYEIVIYAYDKVGERIKVNNPYKFIYSEPTFSDENNLVLNDEEDYELLINGDLSKKDYQIVLFDNGNKISESKLETNTYLIKKEYYANMEQRLDIKILDDLQTISEISLYNKMSPVSDINITRPTTGNILDYNDVTLTYEGGNNATQYIVEIYNSDRLVKSTTVRKNRCVISADLFEKAEKYKIIIKALYQDYEHYTKISEVEFEMNEKDTLKPAYINTNWKNVRPGTKLTLSNPNSDGTIYYSLNGDDPTTSGIKYESPIVVSGNMTIKAVITEPKKNHSIITEYEVNIGQKETYTIYLSPSNQDRNIGVGSVGYTNEAYEMNKLTDYLEKYLKKYDRLKVYRNSPYGNISLWTADSRYYGADLHLAIHSNASVRHDVFGIETWVNEQSSKTYSLANLFQDDLLEIYYTEEEGSNRGVKYANGAFGEVNELAVPFGILLEIGHHDFEADAEWIMQNKELIATTVGDTILRYFDIK